MRRIIFRGRHKATNEWVYGDLEHLSNGNIHIFGNHHSQPVKENTVGQFTEMYDKNKIPIFEGDIVRYYDDIEDELVSNPVVYNEDFCSFCIDDKSRDPIGLCAHWEYEVIGCIHDKTDEK